MPEDGVSRGIIRRLFIAIGRMPILSHILFPKGKRSGDVYFESPWLVFCVLAGIVGMAYGMILWAPAIYDERVFVRENPIYGLPFLKFIRQLVSEDFFQWTRLATYQPLNLLLHYGTHAYPLLDRLIGILLHALNGFLVYLLGRRLLKEPEAAFMAAALFVLFPAHTEAVNITAFQAHLLSFSFSMLCFLCWLASSDAGRGTGRLILAHGFYGLALLSKETGLVALALIGAHVLCFGRDRAMSHLRRGSGLLGLSASYLILRFAFFKPLLPAAQEVTASMAVPSFGWYLKTLIIPYPLCLEHGWTTGLGAVPATEAALTFILPVLFTVLLWFFRQRPLVLFGLLWILCGCLPFLHLIPFVNYSPVADRYLYFSSGGFCLLVASGIASRPWKHLVYALSLAWGVSTVQRNGLYLDLPGLLEQTVSCAPDNPRAYAMRGAYHLEAHEYPKALPCLEAAVALDPKYEAALNDLGLLYGQVGDYRKAERIFLRALSFDRDSAVLHNNLGTVYASSGMTQKALSQFQFAQRIRPDWSAPWLNAGTVLAGQEPDQALRSLLKAKALAPREARVSLYLGDAYWSLRQTGKAILEWEEVIRQEPYPFEAFERLGNAYDLTGDRKSAVATYRRLVQTADRFTASLGLARANVGSQQERDALEQAALRSKARAENALRRLGQR